MVTMNKRVLARLFEVDGLETSPGKSRRGHVEISEFERGDLTVGFDGDERFGNAQIRETLNDTNIPFQETRTADGVNFLVAADSEVSPFSVKPERGDEKVFKLRLPGEGRDRFVIAKNKTEAMKKLNAFGKKTKPKSMGKKSRGSFRKTRM